MSGLNAYINRFNLPNAYRNQSQSVEEYFSLVVGQIPFFDFLYTNHTQMFRWGPCRLYLEPHLWSSFNMNQQWAYLCRCRNVDTLQPGRPTPYPIIHIPFSDLKQTIKETVEALFQESPITNNNCPICRAARNATEKTTLENFPLGLLVHIGRQKNIDPRDPNYA